jgi:tRNA A-37 threonylcarbamoyl transferase component Bud32
VGALLAQLHTAKVIHGDPRIANVIIVDKTYKWIDFRDSYDFTEIGRRNDLALFLESSFPTLKIDQLNQQLVDAYIFETSVDNMKQLIRSVPHVKDPA